MNENLIRLAESIQPAPDSQLTRAIAAVRQRDDACTSFESLLDQRQVEIAAAEHVIVSAQWNSDPQPIEAALSRKNALTVVISKVAAQLETARADVQRAEATLDRLVQKARGIAQSIRELADPNIEIAGLSPARRQTELERQRADLRALIGRDSVSFDDAQSAVRHAAELQAQIRANLAHHRAATV